MYQLNLTWDELVTLRTAITRRIEDLTSLTNDTDTMRYFENCLKDLKEVRRNINTLLLIDKEDN